MFGLGGPLPRFRSRSADSRLLFLAPKDGVHPSASTKRHSAASRSGPTWGSNDTSSPALKPRHVAHSNSSSRAARSTRGMVAYEGIASRMAESAAAIRRSKAPRSSVSIDWSQPVIGPVPASASTCKSSGGWRSGAERVDRRHVLDHRAARMEWPTGRVGRPIGPRRAHGSPAGAPSVARAGRFARASSGPPWPARRSAVPRARCVSAAGNQLDARRTHHVMGCFDRGREEARSCETALYPASRRSIIPHVERSSPSSCASRASAARRIRASALVKARRSRSVPESAIPW